MLCQKCHKRRATIRYAEVVDGRVTDQLWCKECLAQQRNGTEGFELSEVPPTRPSKASIHRVVSKVVRAQRSCPECETRLQAILDTRLVGCAACYDHFADELPALLEKLHESQTHRGKGPQTSDERAQLRSELQAKRALLRSLLRTENYEDAATLRDEIRTLEEGLYASGTGIE
jgi:protein arginine kinase activator